MMRPQRLFALAALALAAGLAGAAFAQAPKSAPTPPPRPPAQTQYATATFAGGCVWCTEADFDKVDGVISTTSGYIGGTVANPTYEQVSGGRTGHTEAVRVVFDPARVSYAKLVEYFWRTIDPTTANRQFCDARPQYRSGIFTHDAEQLRIAQASKAALEKSKPFREPIVTEITPATTFYPAEDYHQDYYEKNPVRYKFYRFNCGRDQRLQELWGKPDKSS
jgi:peptide-methionine (S)-S-oxide reductase